MFLIGIVPRKSLIVECIKIPEVIPYDLERHYWRGLIDGDGSIGWYKRNNSRKGKFSIKLCGSLDICKGFLGFCRKYTTSKANVVASENIYLTAMTEGNAVIMCKVLYDDCTVCLDRKKDIYLNYVDYISKLEPYDHNWNWRNNK